MRRLGLALALALAGGATACRTPAPTSALRDDGTPDRRYRVESTNASEFLVVEENEQAPLRAPIIILPAGTRLYHWGSPEQVDRIARQGRVDGGELEWMINDGDRVTQAAGGGFYVSSSITDSMGYGPKLLVTTLQQNVRVAKMSVDGLVSRDLRAMRDLGLGGVNYTPTWTNLFEQATLTNVTEGKASDFFVAQRAARATPTLSEILQFDAKYALSEEPALATSLPSLAKIIRGERAQVTASERLRLANELLYVSFDTLATRDLAKRIARELKPDLIESFRSRAAQNWQFGEGEIKTAILLGVRAKDYCRDCGEPSAETYLDPTGSAAVSEAELYAMTASMDFRALAAAVGLLEPWELAVQLAAGPDTLVGTMTRPGFAPLNVRMQGISVNPANRYDEPDVFLRDWSFGGQGSLRVSPLGERIALIAPEAVKNVLASEYAWAPIEAERLAAYPSGAKRFKLLVNSPTPSSRDAMLELLQPRPREDYYLRLLLLQPFTAPDASMLRGFALARGQSATTRISFGLTGAARIEQSVIDQNRTARLLRAMVAADRRGGIGAVAESSAVWRVLMDLPASDDEDAALVTRAKTFFRRDDVKARLAEGDVHYVRELLTPQR